MSSEAISKQFALHLHAAPEDGEVDSAKVNADQLNSARFQLSFEEVASALQAIDRIYLEMDGSFMWVGPAAVWQIDGMLYDYGDRLHRMELKGSCPYSVWRTIIGTLGWPEQTVLAFSLDANRLYRIDQLERILWTDATSDRNA